MAAAPPKKMQALVTPDVGSISASEIVFDRPVPAPGAKNTRPSNPPPVLVKVAAAALNPVDAVMAESGQLVACGFPYVLGVDMAGTVEAAAPGSQCAIGDPVWAYTGVGHPGAHLHVSHSKHAAAMKCMCTWQAVALRLFIVFV